MPRGTVSGLVRLNLAVLGGGFAWFAYVDAPITDGAMMMFAAAVLAGLLSVATALYSGEIRLPAGADGAGEPATRGRRSALVLFLVSLALMLASATLTLNLKGTGGDSQDTQTAAV